MVPEGIAALIRILFFPGFLFLIALAFFYEWIDRKFFAKLQNRYGPLYTGPAGLLQPFADFIKLLSKEGITPQAADKFMFRCAPIFFVSLPLLTLFLVPVVSPNALISFEGDLIFVMFSFTLVAVTVFIAGWSSVNRFSTIGSVRAAFQMLGYEIPMTLAMVGPAITAKTLSISQIVNWQAEHTNWFVWLHPLGFAVFMLCSLAELEWVPFDIPKAETEIVAGWATEFSGPKLALIRLGKDLELVLAAALITSLFLGGANGWLTIPPVIIFLLKTTFAVVLLTSLRALFARFRIDQMITGAWQYLLPLVILQIILIQLGLGR
ncbi:MAG: complex I subunit 1 family protein [Thermoproteota archaeon]|nr:complex I subunit 1 family protein [Thermoproteota archaeon]